MPNNDKEIALVDIDGCLLLDGQLNLAVIEKMQRVQSEGGKNVLFTQRNAGLLVIKANRALIQRDPVDEKLGTIAGILQTLRDEYGLTDIQVSTSLDPFYGEPGQYYNDILKPFESALTALYSTALQEADPDDATCQIDTMDENHLVAGKTLQTVINEDSQRIMVYLSTDNDDVNVEAEKVNYLRKNLKQCGATLPKEFRQDFYDQCDASDKAQCLQLMKSIYNQGLAIPDSQQRTPPMSDIYLPLDKNWQYAQRVQKGVELLAADARLKVEVFDDALGNHQDMQTYRMQHPNERVLFQGYWVNGQNVCDYRYRQLLGEDAFMPKFKPRSLSDRQDRVEAILKDLRSSDVEKRIAAESNLEFLGLDAYVNEVSQESRQQHLRHARTQLKQIAQDLRVVMAKIAQFEHDPKEQLAALVEAARLKVARRFLKNDIDNVTRLHTRYIEKRDIKVCVVDAFDPTQQFTDPTYVLTPDALYFVPDCFQQAKGLDIDQDLICDDPAKISAITQRLALLSGTNNRLVNATMQAGITEIIGHVPLDVQLVQCETTAKKIRETNIGCMSKETNLFVRNKIIPFVKGAMETSRSKNLTGIEYLTTRAGDSASIVNFTGDHSYEYADADKDVVKPSADIENIFYVPGNHELHCEGKGTTRENAFALRDQLQRDLHEIQGAGDEQPRVHMPAPYYVRTVRNPDTGQYRSITFHLDSNLLPIDERQQAWLKMVWREKQRLDPNSEIPTSIVVHHSFLETIGKRGASGKAEGKKYANPQAKTGTHHQILFALMERLGIPLKDVIVLNAHEHAMDASVGIDAHSPLATLTSGAGGSGSNQGDARVSKSGSVFVADPGFGFVETIIDEDNKITVTYWRSDDVKLDAAVDSPNIGLTKDYSFVIDYPNKQCIIQNVYFSDKLLSNQQKTFQFLCEAIAQKNMAVLSWYFLKNHSKAIDTLKQHLTAAGKTEDGTCFDDLLHFIHSPDSFADDIDRLYQVVKACLDRMLLPLTNEQSPATFLPPSPELYTVLQAYRLVLDVRKRLLPYQSDETKIVVQLRKTFTEAKPFVSKTSQQLAAATDDMDSDDEVESVDAYVREERNVRMSSAWKRLVMNDAAEEDEDAEQRAEDSIVPWSNSFGLSAQAYHLANPEVREFSQITVDLQSVLAPQIDVLELVRRSPEYSALGKWRQNERPMVDNDQILIAQRLQETLKNSKFLRDAIRSACRDYIFRWREDHKAILDDRLYVDGKAVSDELLPLVNMHRNDFALVYFLDHLAASPQGFSLHDCLHILLCGLAHEDSLSVFRGKLLDYVAIELLNVFTLWSELTQEQLAEGSDRLTELTQNLGVDRDILLTWLSRTAKAKSFIALLDKDSSMDILGKTDREKLGWRLDSLQQILRYYFMHRAMQPEYSVLEHFLTGDSAQILWRDDFWQKHFIETLFKEKQNTLPIGAAGQSFSAQQQAQAIQFCYQIWKDWQPPTWSVRFGWSPAKAASPLQQLANFLMQSANVEHFRSLICGAKLDAQEAQIDAICQNFAIFKAVLNQQQICLPHINKAFVTPVCLTDGESHYDVALFQFYYEVWQEQQSSILSSVLEGPLFQVASAIMNYSDNELFATLFRNHELRNHPFVKRCCDDVDFFKECKAFFTIVKQEQGLRSLPEVVTFVEPENRATLCWQTHPGQSFGSLSAVQSPIHPGQSDVELGLPLKEEEKSNDLV